MVMFHQGTDPSENSELAEQVIASSAKAFNGHVHPDLMAAYHKCSASAVQKAGGSGEDLCKTFDQETNDYNGKAFTGLCAQGYDYFHKSLLMAVKLVGEAASNDAGSKDEAKQIADLATINVAKATGVFDCVFNK